MNDTAHKQILNEHCTNSVIKKTNFKERKISFQSGDKAQINIYNIYIYAYNIARRQKFDTVQTTKNI